MALRFCKQCGTVYDEKVGGCPKCMTAKEVDALRDKTYMPPPTEMTKEEIAAKRRKDWIQICIGVPALIGIIYLMFYILKSIQT